MQLRPEEAAVVEKAVRLAIESVMNVLCAVNSARNQELKRLVADRDREIQRLEGRVKETEAELRLLLRPSSPSPVPLPVPVPVPEQRDSGAELREQSEVRVSLTLQAPGPQEPSMELEQSSSCRGQADVSLSEGGVQSEALCPPEGHPVEETHVRESSYPTQRRLSPGRVKQESLKQEPLSPQLSPVLQDSPVLRKGPNKELTLRVQGTLQGVLGHSHPWPAVSSQNEDPVSSVSTVPWRSRTSMSKREQSEEAMRRRRASWRAASRRYYARKMARLQIHSHLQSHANHRSHDSSLQSHDNFLQSHSHRSHDGSLQSHDSFLQSHSNSLQTHNNFLPSHSNSSQSHSALPSHSNSLQSQSPAQPQSHSSSSPGSAAPFGSDSWRFSVCDLTPLLQPPPPSTDVTFITESELLSDSLT